MKYTFTLLLAICLSFSTFAQVKCSATGDSGSGYPALEAATFGIESPDCEHTSFGHHITQVYDADLDRNVFVFHSHIAEDNDRCQIFDRVRMEVKGGPGTSEEMQHVLGETSYYRWKFKLPVDFDGASSFNHIFQNKAKGGNDDSFPVLTLTARTTILELRHNGGDTGSDLDRLASISLDMLRGKWVEVYMRQVHAEEGELEVTVKDMETGSTLLSYENANIDLWRTGADYNRPKWGMYRSKNSVLKDEVIWLNDFCVSEVDSLLCPGEAIEVADTIAPTPPTNLVVAGVSRTTVDLEWNASEDNFEVTGYDIIQDGAIILSTENTSIAIEGLSAGTTYDFAVQAKDEAGNISLPSEAVTTTTDAEDALPSVATSPSPMNGATNIITSAALSWTGGTNTDSFYVYFGQDQNPPLVSAQIESDYMPALEEFTTYYWSIGAINNNGLTVGDTWSFTTGSDNPDAPWLVYRADDKPEIETAFYDLNAAPAVAAVDQIVADPNGSANTYYAFRSDSADEKFRWRHDYTPADSVVTVVARLQAVDPDVNGICYFEFRGNGFRQKVRINQSTIKLERASPVVEVDLPFDITNEMHTFRFVSNGANTIIYLDENPEPIASAVSDTPSSNIYFEWGKSGGTDYGAQIDWIAMDKTGGYAPGEGTDLPSDLFLSSIAKLKALNVNGESVSGFSPNVKEYTYEVDNTDIPEVSWEGISPLATAIVEDPVTVPNTSAVVNVTAQDGFTNETYTINYVMGTLVGDQGEAEYLKIFPNPAKDKISIRIDDGQQAVATIYTANGEVIRKGIIIKNNIEYDISELPSGAYIFSFEIAGKKNSIQLFKIK